MLSNGKYIMFCFSIATISVKFFIGYIVKVLLEGVALLTGIYFTPPILIFVRLVFLLGP